MDNYSQEELEGFLGAVGTDVRIHRSVVFFNPKHILDFFQNLNGIKHKDTKTQRHEEVYKIPFIIRETPSFT